MQTSTAEIIADFSAQNLIAERIGPDRTIGRIAAVEDCKPGDLVFVDRAEYSTLVGERSPSVVVTSAKLAPLMAGPAGPTLSTPE